MDMLFYVGLAVGMLLGAKFPDLDLVFRVVLGHRSFLTHSPLVVWLLYKYMGMDVPWKRGIVAGMSFAMVIHFAFDLFPSRWSGYALIQIHLLLPLFALPAVVSGIWLAASMLICGVIGLWLLRNRRELLAVLVLMAIAYPMMVQGELSQVLPLLASVLTLVAASMVDNEVVQGRELVRRLIEHFRS